MDCDVYSFRQYINDHSKTTDHIGVCLNLDDIQAHVDEMACSRAVVACSRVTLESVCQVTAVQVMITKIIMATSAHQQTIDIPETSLF